MVSRLCLNARPGRTQMRSFRIFSSLYLLDVVRAEQDRPDASKEAVDAEPHAGFSDPDVFGAARGRTGPQVPPGGRGDRTNRCGAARPSHAGQPGRPDVKGEAYGGE